MLRVFGRLPDTGVSERTEAGVRKASGEETAEELSPAVVAVYGDLTAVFDLIWGLRTRVPAAPVARCRDWSPWARSGRRCRTERSGSREVVAAARCRICAGGTWHGYPGISPTPATR